MERKIENGSRVAEREKKNTGNFSLHNLVRIRADIGDCEWKFNSLGLSPLLKKRRKEYICSNFSIIQFLQFVSQPNIYLNISHFNFCNEGKTTQAQWNIIVSYLRIFPLLTRLRSQLLEWCWHWANVVRILAEISLENIIFQFAQQTVKKELFIVETTFLLCCVSCNVISWEDETESFNDKMLLSRGVSWDSSSSFSETTEICFHIVRVWLLRTSLSLSFCRRSQLESFFRSVIHHTHDFYHQLSAP